MEIIDGWQQVPVQKNAYTDHSEKIAIEAERVITHNLNAYSVTSAVNVNVAFTDPLRYDIIYGLRNG
jgi:hypothetical protein